MRSKRTKRLGAALALAGLGLGITSVVAVPASGDSPGPGTARTEAVTLLTGDRVFLTAQRVSRIVPGNGREGMRFSTREYDGHMYVVPIDAAPDVASGRLDPRLFDVTQLVERGYADNERSDLPLIVQGATTSSLPGVRSAEPLRAVDGHAVRIAKGNKTFWRTALESGADRIWLDGRLKLQLDHSVPQIGAPAAWRAGYTGKGVTVGVLDSGAAANHPDLAGKVAAQKSFVDESDRGDPNGHGTHVSSTIASGDQRYRGVAPDATLVIGKVCTVDGFCDESAALRAMEWAAATQHAKVVNMSFGKPDEEGVDPIEEAVNRLTAKYGTLFVVGAGNDGQIGAHTVSSPASADAALAVGAVDDDDELASFSGRGPRVGDNALKPDVTAPGVGIVAALAKGSALDEGLGWTHISGSGTSMSAPHVTGAAALLFQQHPNWTPAQVKSALMGSAEPSADADAFDQGAGRVDLARAIEQRVLAVQPSIGFGLTSWPHDDDDPITRTLTYQSTSDQDITLRLRIAATGPDGRPADTFGLSRARLTVPAHSKASVRVTADTRGAGPDGEYTGRVLARSGESTVATPVGVVREVESYDLTVKTVDRNAQPAESQVGVLGYANGHGDAASDPSGTVKFRLPRGDYTVNGDVRTGDDPESAPVDLMVRPWLRLRSDRTVVLDARKAKHAPITVERPDAAVAAGRLGYMVHAGEGALLTAVETTNFDNTGIGQVGPDAPADKFVSAQDATLLAPGANGDYANSPYAYNLAWFTPDQVSVRPRHVEDDELASVRTTLLGQGDATEGAFGAGGIPSAAGWTPGFGAGVFPVKLPGGREELFTTKGVAWSQVMIEGEPAGPNTPPGNEDAILHRQWRTYRTGADYQEVWNGAAVFGPSLAGPAYLADLPQQVPDRLLFRVPLFGTSGSVDGVSRYDKAHTVGYRDGNWVCETGRLTCTVEGDPKAGRYRVRSTAERDSLTDMSTKVTAEWAFTHDGTEGPLPVQVVRFAPKLDHANTAPGGQRYAVPVSVQRNPGAPDAELASLSVEVSYDGGKTWRTAPVVDGTVQLRHPDQGYVSLRAKAVDSAGNSVKQTILHAYGLR